MSDRIESTLQSSFVVMLQSVSFFSFQLVSCTSSYLIEIPEPMLIELAANNINYALYEEKRRWRSCNICYHCLSMAKILEKDKDPRIPQEVSFSN